MTRHTLHLLRDRPLTVEDLDRLWQQFDAPLTPDELHRLLRRRRDRMMVAAWSVTVVLISTILIGGVWLMRVVGHALEGT